MRGEDGHGPPLPKVRCTSSRTSPVPGTGHGTCRSEGTEVAQGDYLDRWRPAERPRTVDRNRFCLHSHNGRQSCSDGAGLRSPVGMPLHGDYLRQCPYYHRSSCGTASQGPREGTPGYRSGFTRAATRELGLTAVLLTFERLPALRPPWRQLPHGSDSHARCRASGPQLAASPPGWRTRPRPIREYWGGRWPA